MSETKQSNPIKTVSAVNVGRNGADAVRVQLQEEGKPATSIWHELSREHAEYLHYCLGGFLHRPAPTGENNVLTP